MRSYSNAEILSKPFPDKFWSGWTDFGDQKWTGWPEQFSSTSFDLGGPVFASKIGLAGPVLPG